MEFIIYLAGVCDNFKVVMVLVSVVGFLISSVSYIFSFENEILQKCRDKISKIFVASLIGFIASSLVPNRETIVAMVTIPPAINYVQNNEEFKELPNNVVKFINDYLSDKSSDK